MRFMISLIASLIGMTACAQSPLEETVGEDAARIAAIQQRLDAAGAIAGRMRMYVDDELVTDARFVFTDQNVFSVVSADQEVRQSAEAMWWYYPGEHQYRKTARLGPDRPVWLKFLGGMQPFVKATMPFLFRNAPYSLEQTPKSIEPVRWSGHDALRVEVPNERDPQGYWYWYLDMSGRLPLGWEQSSFDKVVRVLYSDIVLDPPLQVAQFDWTPPADAVAYDNDSYQQQVNEVRAGLLAPGVPAPDFTLARYGGGEMSLAQRFQRNKLTLLTFWFYNCASCLDELPYLNELHQKLDGKGFEVIGMNYNDPPRLIDKLYDENGYSMPVAMIDPKNGPDVPGAYKVVMYPTNYLVDSRGQVVKGWLGPPEDLEQLLRDGGFELQ